MTPHSAPSREQLVHSLYEPAELEHNLMCTYLYAAFSLKDGPAEGLSAGDSAVVAGWRRTILDVAIEEMGHLAAVWNITAALGAAPRIGRMNFPLDPGYLPAGIVVKLAPFSAATLQHFIHLERPEGSSEPDGAGYSVERHFVRGSPHTSLTPMAVDYETVGEFYATLGRHLRAFVAQHGEDATFCGNPALQLGPAEVDLAGVKPVICLKTALAAFDAIVAQGEGAPGSSEQSHYVKFAAIRSAHAELMTRNPSFAPAHPAATNPVLCRPPRPEGRVWIENPAAVAAVDLANAAYGLMLRLMSYAYSVPSGPEKSLAVDLGIGLMRGITPMAERAARVPAGPANPDCNAGMSFTAMRDTSPLPRGPGAWQFFTERLSAFSAAADVLAQTGDARCGLAARMFAQLAQRAKAGANLSMSVPSNAKAAADVATPVSPPSQIVDGVEIVEGKDLTLKFEAKRCIHARFCVTGAPKVFLANVQGPWIHPDQMDVERLADIAHACPSGAIRYTRKDGRPDEGLPPVNLISVREAGPYAVRADIVLDGAPAGTRATLCRCGASKNKPYCDGSHHDVSFTASGEPPTGTATDMLPVRDGPLQIDPQVDGPLQIRGNLEIISGTGRMVTRVTSAKLCRCGGSQTKPYCDGTHARNGFRS